MTDQPQHRFHGRDTGAIRQPVGVDRSASGRDHLVCSATCRCGTVIAADSISALRDLVACHMTACDG